MANLSIQWLEELKTITEKVKEGPDNSRQGVDYWEEWGRLLRKWGLMVNPGAVLELIEAATSTASVLNDNPVTDERPAKTMYVVEASSHEYMSLFKEFSKEHTWNDDTLGLMRTIGLVGTAPVSVHYRWVAFNENLVCFWEPTSQMVDYNLIEQAHKVIFPKKAKFCDADGFYNTVIRDQEVRREKHKK